MTQATRGAALLEALINPKTHTQASVGRAAGVSAEAVRHWRKGISVPTQERRDELERAFGIPASAWDEVIEPTDEDGKAA